MTRRVVSVGALTVLCVVVSASAQSPRADFVLDVAARGESRVIVSVTLEETRSARPYRLPSGVDVEVSIVKIGLMDQFAWGDEILYEILVRNVGRTDVELPWLADTDLHSVARIDMTGAYKHAGVFLEVVAADGKTTLGSLDPQLLAGVKDRPDTIQRLRPQETALLKLRGRWMGLASTAESTFSQPNGAVRLRAMLALFSDVHNATSSNSIPVTVFPRDR